MNGGKISGNTAGSGGGISISQDAIFTMNGGKISGNTAVSGGGVYIIFSRSLMNMNGGIISGNTATGGGGISIGGGTLKKLSPNGGGQNTSIIYGSEATGVDADGIPLRNTASDDNYGHAVRHESKWRNTTAWQTDYIDSTTGRGLSGSGYPPYGE
jgi:hypothetical protein